MDCLFVAHPDHTYLGLDALLRSCVELVLLFVVAGSLGSHGGRSCSCAAVTNVSPLQDGVGGVLVVVVSSFGESVAL